jgi:hypothetical protein
MFNGKNSISLILILVGFMFMILQVGLTVLVVTGCGGGDSASNQNDNSRDSTVALFLADGPADDFDHIWIEVSEISLLPQGDGAPAVIYKSDNPAQIDLLTLQEDDLLLAVNSSIPAGTYNKIRMMVENVEGQQGNQTIDFHLASNKFDLNPKGNIDVTPGETLSLRLDIDADKSIHVAGPKYNFRPVVFVDAGPMENPHPCNHMIKGEITELFYAEQDDEKVIGFRITPFDANTTLDVYFQDDVIIFDDNGKPTGLEILAIDQIVCISGALDTDGRFLAGIVVIGEVQTISGIVETAVDDENQFLFNPMSHLNYLMASSDPLDDIVTVALSDGTIIMLGDSEVGADQIQPDQKARIAGKMDPKSQAFNAIAVILKPQQIKGILTAITPAEDGHLLTIKSHTAPPHDDPIGEAPKKEGNQSSANKESCYEEEETTVFLPDSAPIEVKGGKTLTVDDLSALVECDPPQVQVLISSMASEDAPAQASALYVLPQMVMMTVGQIDPDTRIITSATTVAYACVDNTNTLHVPEGTPIWLHNEEEQTPIEFGEIQVGDFLMVAAIKTCELADYEAVVVIKAPECDLPDDPDEPGDPCIPQYEQIDMTVDSVDTDENIIKGDDETSVAVTEQTIYIDLTRNTQSEMGLEDIVKGDTLVCHIVRECDDQPDQALLVVRVDPKSDVPLPDPDSCDQYGIKMVEVEIKTVDYENGIIETTDDKIIQVPDGIQIYTQGEIEGSELTINDLAEGDRLEILAILPCEDGQAWTALRIRIIKQVDTE